ncbi:MAG: hypothetical protein IT282_16265 [Bacteroidetes bacterium]|nr:hypothetical protein [Bacteroidota bacterium]
MTHAEQKRMILELRDYTHRMTRDEEELFQMYVKRNKDDEDLDNIAQRRLTEMYERYVVRRPRRI